MKIRYKELIAFIAAIGLMVPYSVLATNGYFSHGYGTKNKGLAGGGGALPQDAMISATNPAGMAFVEQRIDAGIALFSPRRSYTASSASSSPDGTFCGANCPFTIGGASGGQTIDSDNEAFLVPHFAYSQPLDTMSTFGVAVYGNGGMNTEYSGGVAQHNDGLGTLATSSGTFGAGKTGVNLEQLFINASYARKFADKGSWGVSAIYAFQRFKAEGLGNFAGFSVDPTNVTDKGTDDSTGLGWKVGVQGEVVSGITLAASYQAEIDMDKFSKYSGLYAEGGDFDIPATLTLGAAWHSSKTAVLTFDVQQIYYSDVPAIANGMDNLVGADSCATGNTEKCLGGSQGAGFGWEDMTIYKLGYQWESSPKWIWRAGFSTGDQPIRSSEVVFNVLAPGVMEEHITFGFTRKTSQDSEFNFTAMYAPKSTVSGTNPLNPSQTVTVEMTQYEVEASWGWKF